MDERKIFIVEDEGKIADTLRFGLMEKGYFVEVAYDGTIGHRLFQSNKYNLIILDINLPGISGFELWRIIRASDPHIPVIMLTSLLTIKDKVEGYDAVADDYVVKPFAVKDRGEVCRTFLRSSSENFHIYFSRAKFSEIKNHWDL